MAAELRTVTAQVSGEEGVLNLLGSGAGQTQAVPVVVQRKAVPDVLVLDEGFALPTAVVQANEKAVPTLGDQPDRRP